MGGADIICRHFMHFAVFGGNLWKLNDVEEKVKTYMTSSSKEYKRRYFEGCLSVFWSI